MSDYCAQEVRHPTATLSDTLGRVRRILLVLLEPFAGVVALLPLVALARRAVVCLGALHSQSTPSLSTDEALSEEIAIAPQRLPGTHGLLML